jgi:hypothetical protein
MAARGWPGFTVCHVGVQVAEVKHGSRLQLMDRRRHVTTALDELELESQLNLSRGGGGWTRNSAALPRARRQISESGPCLPLGIASLPGRLGFRVTT